MNIALVDDMKMEIIFIRTILKQYSIDRDLEISTTCFHSAEDLLSDYEKGMFDLFFLDIYMEGMSGVEAARQIRETDPDTTIVFLSSSLDFMQDAFYIHAYDYIEKPATKERVYHTMDAVLQKRGIFQSPKFTFSSNRIEYNLSYSDLIMISTGSANYLDILDKYGNTYRTRMTFSSVCHLLEESESFLLVIRGVLVNMDYITDIRDGVCYIKGGIVQPVNGRNCKKIVQMWKDYKSPK